MLIASDYCFLIFSAAFLCVTGLNVDQNRFKRQVLLLEEPTEKCLQPPENTKMERCCRLPKEHVWGNIKATMYECMLEMKEKERQEMRRYRREAAEEEVEPEDVGEEDGNGDEGTQMGTSEDGPDRKWKGQGKFRRMFRGRHKNGCFMECVFKREGFLKQNKVSKEALLSRIQTTLVKDTKWRKVAVAAVQKCFATEFEINPNDTCTSGSDAAIKCVFRNMYLDCPFWNKKSDYCKSLREFYVECPNGPPPEMYHKRKRGQKYHEEEGEEGDEIQEEMKEPALPEQAKM